MLKKIPLYGFTLLNLAAVGLALLTDDKATTNVVIFDIVVLTLAFVFSLAIGFNETLTTYLKFCLIYVWPDLKRPERNKILEDLFLYVSYGLAVCMSGCSLLEGLGLSGLLIMADLRVNAALDVLFEE